MNSMLQIMQHALGLDKYGQGTQFRNHFVAGGPNLELCREAASQGLMREHEATVISGGSPWFSVTREGINYVGTNSPAKPPEAKLSRGQQRYRRYRQYGDMFENFLEFCRWDAEPERSWNGG